MSGPLPRCRRTPAIVERMLADGIAPEDRHHVDSCAACAAAVAEARRFEVALNRSAGALVDEPLPRSSLDAPPLAPPRRAWRRPAALLAATAVVSVAAVLTASLVDIGRDVGAPAATPAPLPADRAVPGMSVAAAEHALRDVGLACEAAKEQPAGLECSGRDAATGAMLYATLVRAGSDGVAELKASMSVRMEERASSSSKRPEMGTEQSTRRVSDDAFLSFFTPLVRLPFAEDRSADPGDLDRFVATTIGGANGSCQCERRIDDVRIVLEGSVGLAWDLLVMRR
jgi:hypothetical protein